MRQVKQGVRTPTRRSGDGAEGSLTGWRHLPPVPRSAKAVAPLLAGLLILGYPHLLPRSEQTKEKPFVTFTDITQESGLASFKIICGDKVTDFLIDVNGEGAAFFDYDNDGYQDIYLVNGSSRTLEKSAKPPHEYLLHNNGDGTFTDVTAKAHLGAPSWGGGVAVGDYNNDGYLDLYVTNYGANRLYRNNGDGTFTDVAEAAGVANVNWSFPKWSMGAAFGDIDNDGYLDLYVTNFAKFYYQPNRPAPSATSPCKLKDVPVACAPDQYEGSQALLYHNNGNGTFTDVTQSAGITQPVPGRGFAVVFSDFNNEGRQDVFQANDSGPNFFYLNNGKGHFTEDGFSSGTAVDGLGNVLGSMGVTVGDINHDGLPDIFVTHFVDQPNTLYINEGGHMFSDQTVAYGLWPIGYHYSGWGTKFEDFDNDGWLDLWITNGHTMEQLEQHYPGDPFAEPNYVLRNVEGKKFVDVSEAAGIRRLPATVGRGTAFGDFDNDGDIDVLVINKNDAPTFWRNDGGNARNWMTIRTEGVKSNRCGIGARILATADGARQSFEVRGSDSYLSSNDLRVHIGLADSKKADIEIHWPSGQVDKYSGVAANKFYLAREGDSLAPDPRVKPLHRRPN
ncbi:MAG TPA: CRTAC1 family protein [Terriglobia bacterium]|nr:CRTAC1 family protein [Terriglobia bacterium]